MKKIETVKMGENMSKKNKDELKNDELNLEMQKDNSVEKDKNSLEKSETSSKAKGKFLDVLKKCRVNFQTQIENMKGSGASLVWTVILTFAVMVVICLLVFFASVQGAEKVMVPNVVGKTLTNALLEMQEKELYPKIQLRYSDEIGDAGTIIEQNPVAGEIVKAYRRVTLTVSRGIALDEIGDYVGQNFDEVSHVLNEEFNNEFSMVKLANASFIADKAEKGTILMQFPEAGTGVFEPLTLYLIVSNGNEVPLETVPELTGLSIRAVLAKMSHTNLTFNFNSVKAESEKKSNTVVSMENAKEEIPAFSRVNVNIALAEQKSENENVQGILTYNLPEYPVPVSVELKSVDEEGKSVSLVRFNHPGDEISIPYDVKRGSTLRLFVLDEKIYEELVQ